MDSRRDNCALLGMDQADLMILLLNGLDLLNHTLDTTTVPGKMLIGGGQLFYTAGRHINPRSAIDLPDLEYNPVSRVLDKVGPSCMNTDLKQIFIRLIKGRHCCVQIRKGMSVLELKKDQHTLQHYGVVKDSILCNLDGLHRMR